MSVPLEMFLTGLALGVGPCTLFCLPILIPFVAGTMEGWVVGIKATLAFSLSRLAAYVLLGLAAGDDRAPSPALYVVAGALGRPSDSPRAGMVYGQIPGNQLDIPCPGPGVTGIEDHGDIVRANLI